MRISPSHRRGRDTPAPAVIPLTVLACAFLANVLGAALHEPRLWTAGAHAETVGVAVGSLALLPAAAGWLGLARGARGRRRRAAGVTLHAAALVLFALARWVRGSAKVSPDPATLLVQGIGIVLLALAAWPGRRTGDRTVRERGREVPAEARG